MQEAQTFRPTFLQKLLGQNYKWWYVIKYNITLANARISGNLISILSFVINTVAIMYVWSLSKPGAEVFSYLLIGRIYKSISENTSSAFISIDILRGGFTSNLLRPQPLLFYYYCQSIGKRSIANLTQTVAAIIATLISLFYFAELSFTSWPNLLIILTFIPISFTLNHLIGNLLGFLAFYIRDSRDYTRAVEVYVNFNTIIIGYIIPLNLIPGGAFYHFCQQLGFYIILCRSILACTLQLKLCTSS